MYGMYLNKGDIMPTYTEPSKSNVIYHKPSGGWFSDRWFTKWFNKGKGEPSYTEPTKTTATYTEPSK